MNTTFQLYPALDIRAGGVVRLFQGDYRRERRYDAEPLALAARWRAAGADWLHLVDLDAARSGGCSLHALVRQLAALGLQVQVGGGVRTATDVGTLLEAGASRVVVGSRAVTEPETVMRWLDDIGAERITVALDTRMLDGQWQLPVLGWTVDSGRRLFDLVGQYAAAGLRHLLVTDIDRDGMLSGPSSELYADLAARMPTLALQASGGIRDGDDLVALRRQRLAGAVTGRALLDGRLSIAEALAC